MHTNTGSTCTRVPILLQVLVSYIACILVHVCSYLPNPEHLPSEGTEACGECVGFRRSRTTVLGVVKAVMIIRLSLHSQLI